MKTSDYQALAAHYVSDISEDELVLVDPEEAAREIAGQLRDRIGEEDLRRLAEAVAYELSD